MSVRTPGAGPQKVRRPPMAVRIPSRADFTAATPETSRGWIWAAGFGIALLAVLIAYWPALQGEFVFDDVHMEFLSPHPETLPLRRVGVKPASGR